MKTGAIFFLTALFAFAGCGAARTESPPVNVASEVPTKPGQERITSEAIEATIGALVATHGEGERSRVDTGVRQVATQWWPGDGSTEEFSEFCNKHFVTDPERLSSILARFNTNIEEIQGHLSEIYLQMNRPLHLDTGPVSDLDLLFAKYDPWSHVEEDFYSSKVAFLVLLNFQVYDLAAMLEQGSSWDRSKWAEARMTNTFNSRVPSPIQKAINSAEIDAQKYVGEYNIHMHHLVTEDEQRLFPEGLKLISHWGLRDELRSRYKDPDGLKKQRLIQKVMEQILKQEIPAVVIDNPHVDWNPVTNEVKASSVVDFTPDDYAHKKELPVVTDPEGGDRYQIVLNNFLAQKAADPYSPIAPTYIDRKFNQQREIAKERVVELLDAMLTSDLISEVAQVVKKRVGRELEPFDIWYDGFATDGAASTEELDKKVLAKYPSVAVFQADIPRILKDLGFDDATATYLSDRVVVEPSRGAGHAMPAFHRKAKTRLRTRIPKDGMLYKGYNIAVHELGHNVEQVFSLYDIDYYLLKGVPNIAFSEGFAFSFQERNWELLGVAGEGPDQAALVALDRFWFNVKNSAVAMVDIGIWDWLYAHPDATAQELGQAVLKISKDVWNKYLAPVYGTKDQIILAIYSHILYAGLYTPDYALGQMIFAQMDEFFQKNGLAKEMKRMCTIGSVTPDEWMRQAVGSPISATPLIEAARTAVLTVNAAE